MEVVLVPEAQNLPAEMPELEVELDLDRARGSRSKLLSDLFVNALTGGALQVQRQIHPLPQIQYPRAFPGSDQ